MNKEKYTSLEIGILLFFLLNSFTSSILIKSFSNKNAIDITISILIALLLGMPLLNLLFRQWKYDFLNNISNNKIITIIFKIVFIISSLSISLYSIFNLSVIIKDIILPNTSQKLTALVFLLLTTILALKGLKSISIATNLMFFFYVIIIMIDLVFNLFNVDTINLLPMTINLDELNFFETLILTLSPLFMILIIPKGELNNFRDCKKKMNIFYLIFFIYFILKILFIISILGEKYFSIISYPEIEILKMINIFNFFERLEELLIVTIFIENLITTAFAINYSATIANSIFNLEEKIYIIIDVIIFILLLKIDMLSNIYLVIILSIFIIFNLFTKKEKRRKN